MWPSKTTLPLRMTMPREQSSRTCPALWLTIIIVTHSMQQAARISDYTAFFLQEVAGEPATLIEYGQTDAIFTSPVDSRTEDYITGRFG